MLNHFLITTKKLAISCHFDAATQTLHKGSFGRDRLWLRNKSQHTATQIFQRERSENRDRQPSAKNPTHYGCDMSIVNG